jgi:hypothetical protein
MSDARKQHGERSRIQRGAVGGDSSDTQTARDEVVIEPGQEVQDVDSAGVVV